MRRYWVVVVDNSLHSPEGRAPRTGRSGGGGDPFAACIPEGGWIHTVNIAPMDGPEPIAKGLDGEDGQR